MVPLWNVYSLFLCLTLDNYALFYLLTNKNEVPHLDIWVHIVLQLVLDDSQKWQHTTVPKYLSYWTITTREKKRRILSVKRERETHNNKCWWSKCWYYYCHYLALYTFFVYYSVTSWGTLIWAEQNTLGVLNTSFFFLYLTLFRHTDCVTRTGFWGDGIGWINANVTSIQFFLLLYSARRFLTRNVCTINDRPVHECVYMIQFYSISKFSVFCVFLLCFFLLLLFRVFAPRFCFAHFYFLFPSLSFIRTPIHLFICSHSRLVFIFFCSSAQITGIHKAITNVFTGFNAIIQSSIYYCS